MIGKIDLIHLHIDGPRRLVSFGRHGVVPKAYTKISRHSINRLCHIANCGDWRLYVNPTGWHAHRKEESR